MIDNYNWKLTLMSSNREMHIIDEISCFVLFIRLFIYLFIYFFFQEKSSLKNDQQLKLFF